MNIEKTAQRRVGLLDEIRGLCILGVVLFHGLYDLVYIFDLSVPWFQSFFIQRVIQPVGAGAFIFISGIVSRYSRNNLKRGVQVLGLGMSLTLVLYLFMPDSIVRYGILSLLGTGMLLYGLAEKYAPRLLKVSGDSPVPGMLGIFYLLIAFFTSGTAEGYFGFFGKPLVLLPKTWYTTSYLYPLGFPSPEFFSTDYFPILPWLFVFLAGAYIGIYFLENKMPDWVYRNYLPPLEWAGKHSLLIYLFHQPVIYGILTLAFQLRS